MCRILASASRARFIAIAAERGLRGARAGRRPGGSAAIAIAGAGEADAAGGAAEHEPRQRRLHHQRHAADAGAPSRRAAIDAHGGELDRARGVAAQAEAVERPADLDPGRVRGDQVELGHERVGRRRPRRWRRRTSRRGRAEVTHDLCAVDHDAVAVRDAAREACAQKWLRVAALGEGERRQVRARRDRAQDVAVRAAARRRPASSVCVAISVHHVHHRRRRARARRPARPRPRSRPARRRGRPAPAGTPSPSSPRSASPSTASAGNRASRSTESEWEAISLHSPSSTTGCSITLNSTLLDAAATSATLTR